MFLHIQGDTAIQDIMGFQTIRDLSSHFNYYILKLQNFLNLLKQKHQNFKIKC